NPGELLAARVVNRVALYSVRRNVENFVAGVQLQRTFAIQLVENEPATLERGIGLLFLANQILLELRQSPVREVVSQSQLPVRLDCVTGEVPPLLGPVPWNRAQRLAVHIAHVEPGSADALVLQLPELP